VKLGWVGKSVGNLIILVLFIGLVPIVGNLIGYKLIKENQQICDVRNVKV
jgi:hypothetical protein